MVKEEDSNRLNNRDRDSILNKVFGYFRDE